MLVGEIGVNQHRGDIKSKNDPEFVRRSELFHEIN